MKKHVLSGIACIMAATLLSGCKVDEEYNLENLDTEVTLLKGKSFPVGSLKRITLNDLFQLDGYDNLITAANGDYHIHVPFSKVKYDVDIPLTDEVIAKSGREYEIGGFPGFLSGQEGSIDVELEGVEVSFKVESTMPQEITVGTKVDLTREGKVLRQYEIKDIPLAPGNTEFVFNEKGSGSRSDVVYMAVPELDKFFSPVPDRLKIDDFSASIPADATPGTYPMSCIVTVDSPVAFSANSRCSLTIPVEDAKMELEQVGLKKAILSMKAVNSVPLEFSLAATAMDGKGGYLSGITAKTDVPVAAGTQSSPVTTNLTVTLTTDGDLRFQGLELKLQASSNASVAGVLLNKNQGLELQDLVLTLPDGITVKL